MKHRLGTKPAIRGEYDPSKDQGGVQYHNWGKASQMGKVAQEPRATLSEEEKQAYREYMKNQGPVQETSKEAAKRFRFDTKRPKLRQTDENTKTNVSSDGDIDLNRGDLKERGTQDVIRRLIANDAQINESGGEIMEEYAKKRKAEREQNMSASTDVSVDRKRFDITTHNLSKNASEPDVFEDEEVSPVKLYRALVNLWDQEWLEWEPETITQTSSDEGYEIGPVNLGKIFAIRALLKVPERVYANPRVFEKVSIAFASRLVDWGIVQKPQVHEIAAMVALAKRYFGFDVRQVTEEIGTYIAGCAISDGFVLLPPQLRSIADDFFSTQLALMMGDDALEAQDLLLSALEEEERPSDEYVVQYMKVMRCMYHVQAMIDEADE